MFITKLPQPKLSAYGRSNGTQFYILNKDYEYKWEAKGYKRKIIVKEGYITDLASIPRIAWSFTGLTPSGLISAAALPHDLLCEHKGNLPEGSCFIFQFDMWLDISHRHWTRKQADKLFGRIMKDSGVRRIKRRAAYLAVRMYGAMFGW